MYKKGITVKCAVMLCKVTMMTDINDVITLPIDFMKELTRYDVAQQDESLRNQILKYSIIRKCPSGNGSYTIVII